MTQTEMDKSEMVSELFYLWIMEFHPEEVNCKSQYDEIIADGCYSSEFCKWIVEQI